jgi:hypothetical protein
VSKGGYQGLAFDASRKSQHRYILNTIPDSSTQKTNLAQLFMLYGGVVSFILVFFIMPALFAKHEAAKELSACLQKPEDIREIEGLLRIAGPHFFIETDQWHVLMPVCAGKTRKSCLEADGGIAKTLEDNVGNPIRAWECKAGIVEFEVAGVRYQR